MTEAGPRRCGYAERRRHAGDVHARVPVLAIFEIPDRARLPDHQCNCFAGVERAAAAERDHAIVRTAPICRHAVRDVRLHRVCLQVGEDFAREAGAAAGLDSLRDHRQSGEPGIGDEQRTRDTQRLARIGQLRDAARAEAD